VGPDRPVVAAGPHFCPGTRIDQFDSDIFAVQDEIVDKVVTTLGLLFKLGEMKLTHPATRGQLTTSTHSTISSVALNISGVSPRTTTRARGNGQRRQSSWTRSARRLTRYWDGFTGGTHTHYGVRIPRQTSIRLPKWRIRLWSWMTPITMPSGF
jgi:hypothetical protein